MRQKAFGPGFVGCSRLSGVSVKNYEVIIQPSDLASVPRHHYVGTQEEVLELVQRCVLSSEGTLISVRKLPPFSPMTRA